MILTFKNSLRFLGVTYFWILGVANWKKLLLCLSSYPTGYWCYILLYSLSHMVCSKPNLNQKNFIIPSGAESKNFLFRKSHCCFFPAQCSVKTSKFSIFYHYCPPPLEIRAFIFEQKLCCTYSCFLLIF